MHFLRILIPASALIACGPADDAAEPSADPARVEVDPESAAVFDLVRVTEGVYAMPVKADRDPSQFASSVIIVRDDHVLVVDSRHTPTSGRSLIATVRTITPLPVRYLVNTHWHGDHVQGNEAFREVFPDVQIIGGATIDEDMRTIGRQRLDEEIAELDERLEGVRRYQTEGTLEDGSPLDEDDLATVERQLEIMEAYRNERAELELIPPDILVEDELVLDDAEPVARIVRVGPAHTRGDVVVHLPSKRLLALGDLIEDGFPWFGDGYPSGWADALDRLVALDARIFLPAHGPVLYEPDMLETQRIFVRILTEEARSAVERGLGPESVRENAGFSGFEEHFTRRLHGMNREAREEEYDAFLLRTFERAFAEAAGELSDGGR